MREDGVLNSASIIADAYNKFRRKHRSLPKQANVCYVAPSETLEHRVVEMLQATPRPTAFLCWDELCGLEVLRILSGEGLRIPQDVSVLGSQILPTSPIACVQIPLETMAIKAVELMLAWLKVPTRIPASLLIKPSGILPRETLGKAPQRAKAK